MMMSNSKKFIYFLCLIITVALNLKSIIALEGSSTSYSLSSYHQNDYDTLWRTGFTILDTINGKVAWCLEPDIVTAKSYYFTKQYPLVYNNGYYWKNGRKQITYEDAQMLGLIAYYGYYSTNKTELDRCLTQSAIWYYLSDDSLKEKTILREVGNQNYSYEKEVLEIIQRASCHTINKPFNQQEVVLYSDVSYVLTDSTGTLAYFRVEADEGIFANIQGNDLRISVSDYFQEGTIYLINDANPLDEENLFWLSNLSNPTRSYQILTSPYYQGEDVVAAIRVRVDKNNENSNISLFQSNFRFIKKEYFDTISSTSKWNEDTQKDLLEQMISQKDLQASHQYTYEQVVKQKLELHIPSQYRNLEWIRKYFS